MTATKSDLMRQRGSTPASRVSSDQILVRALGEEMVVYDRRSDRAHALDATAASIWRSCDGQRSAGEIAARVSAELGEACSEEAVGYGLSELARRGLVEGGVQGRPASPGLSRREVLARLGAAAALVPVISTIVVPHSAQAGSCQPSGAPCSTGLDCCSGTCSGGRCA